MKQKSYPARKQAGLFPFSLPPTTDKQTFLKDPAVPPQLSNPVTCFFLHQQKLFAFPTFS